MPLLLIHVLTVDIVDPLTFKPSSYTQASKYLHWCFVMQIEFDARLWNCTWSLVPYQPSPSLVDCSWVFKIKRKANGSIERHKIQHVAEGFNKNEGFDYDKTFTPIVKRFIRTCLDLALSRQWPLRRLCVWNAFLNGHAKRSLYRAATWLLWFS